MYWQSCQKHINIKHVIQNVTMTIPTIQTNCPGSIDSHQMENQYKALSSLEDYNCNTNTFSLENNLGSMSYACHSCVASMWKDEIHTGTLSHTAKFSLCC